MHEVFYFHTSNGAFIVRKHNNKKREVQPLLIHNKTKRCKRCGRDLPLERFGKGQCWCKNCCSTYNSELKGTISKENIVTIERLYKNPLPMRVLDIKCSGVKLIAEDECFVELIDYKRAWVSNYGRVLEYNGNKYVLKRIKKNCSGEKICTLQENVYNGTKWVFKKNTIDILSSL